MTHIDDSIGYLKVDGTRWEAYQGETKIAKYLNQGDGEWTLLALNSGNWFSKAVWDQLVDTKEWIEKNDLVIGDGWTVIRGLVVGSEGA